MLDVSYVSWSALVAACREARAYLRNPDNPLASCARAEDYSFSKIRPMFEERAVIVGNGFAVRIVSVDYID